MKTTYTANRANTYYNIELLSDSTEAEALNNFLEENGFKFEVFTGWSMTSFSIFIRNAADYELLDDFIYNDMEG